MKRRFLLDTNIASFVIKGSRPKIIERLSKQPRANVGVSVITEMELRFGLARLEDAQQLEQRVNEFLFAVPVLTLPEDIALSYGSAPPSKRMGRASVHSTPSSPVTPLRWAPYSSPTTCASSGE